MMMTSSAPISKENLNFLKSAFCVPIFEAYGLTETSAPTTCTHLNDPDAGHVGGVICSNEIKLEDIPAMNYLSTNEVGPQGEICIRGVNVMKGYYKKPELTAESVDKDGWFHTGDVG
jgi:long-chain acyl-CoA synthetase